MSTKESTVRRARIGEMKLGGVGLYPFDNNWTEFKKLINKIDKAYNEIG